MILKDIRAKARDLWGEELLQIGKARSDPRHPGKRGKFSLLSRHFGLLAIRLFVET